MNSEALDTDKQRAIAQAAFQVFAEYGFRKTSMQLIAERAEMSRPALYMHFQSKEDVFNHLSVNFWRNVAMDVDAVLARSGTAARVLADVFDAFDPGGVMAVLLDADHGQELMEVKSGAASVHVDKIATDIRHALTGWLAREAQAGRITCADPAQAGQTIMSAFYGLKAPLPSYAEYKARTAQLAAMIGAGLDART